MLSCSTLALRRLFLAVAFVLLATPIAHSQDEKEAESTPESPPPAPAESPPPAPVDGVVIELSRSMFAPGDDAQITVTNARAGSIFIAGCGSHQVELFRAETYTPLPGEHCVSEGEAVEIPPGSHTLSYSPGPERAGQILRIAVPYGWGCEAGRELSQARCTEFATAASSSFRVAKKGKN